MWTRIVSCIFFIVSIANGHANQVETKKSPQAYYKNLSTGLEKLLQQLPKEAHAGISVISLKTGLVLYEKNPEQLFIPADVAQLFTVGAAFYKLGPEHLFKTTLYADSPIRAGILTGNLYLQGGADPALSLSDLESLVRNLRLLGLKKIEGNLIIDASLFDEQSEAPGSIFDEQSCLSPPLSSALTIHRNSIDLWIEPATTASVPPKIFAFPKTSFVKIENLATTDEKANTLRIHRSFSPSLNTVQIKGEVKLRSPLQATSVSLENPSLYAASLFSSLLKKGGIDQVGTMALDKTPPHAQKLGSISSPPLSSIASTLLHHSDTLYANNLFKKLGQLYVEKEKGQGSWKTGSQALLHHLKVEAGISMTNGVLVDGSGLSRYNLISPRQTTHYLKWIYKNTQIAEDFMAALPHSRFASHQWVRIKQGSLNGVRTLAGFIKSQEGELFALSFMIGSMPASKQKEVAMIETKICDLLVQASH